MNTNNDRQAPMSRAEARKRRWREPPAASKHEMQTRKQRREEEDALPWLENDAVPAPLLAEAGEIRSDAPVVEAEGINHSAETSLISMSPASTLSFGYVSPVSSSRASTIPVSSPASTVPVSSPASTVPLSLASSNAESLASTVSLSPVQAVNMFPQPIAQPQPAAAAASWWTRGWCTIS